MVFEVHRADRSDLLADGLAQLLRDPLPDPFARELVIVPARGVERWLSQRLSHRLGRGKGHSDGVCAGVDFRSPTSLVAEILGTTDSDPWAPETLTWPLLRVVDAVMGEPWARVLAEHLGHGVPGEEGELRRGRRLAVCRRLAGLFASYAVQRPALLADWEAGGSGDGGGGPLPADLAWQPELWRRLLVEVDEPSPVRRHARVVEELRAGAATPAVPSRVSLFGHTRLSESEAALVAALGTHRDVHLWLPHPSDALWRRVRSAPPAGWRRDDHSHAEVTHPLLAAMARDAREGEATLLAAGATDTDVRRVVDRPDTLLGRLQTDLSDDVEPRSGGRPDGTVQVHACHGPARQVEVLREVVLGLLADDPTLEPRDILVMCPDIEAYAPLVSGAFGLGEAVSGSHPGHQLRVMLADRSPTQTNPLLGVLSRLLDLSDGRAEATRVLDLLGTDPVRRRFGFSDQDLEKMTSWVTSSGIRWAWDQAGRARFGLADFPQNTWRFGLDRVLAGVALSDDSHLWIGPTLPLDDVSTTDISLAGRFAEAVDRLQALTDRLTGTHEVERWLDLLRDAMEQLADVPRGEEWQFAQAHRELAALGRDAARNAGGNAGTGPALELRLSDVRALLHRQLAGRPTRANFRTGTLTICTMTPMRAVPHRVVCLLGLDDGVFPRGGAIDGDDVLARLPRVGERDVRSEDRQLFLDAIMSASERLVITYTGFNESTGQPRPPSVPLREFLDVAEHTAGVGIVQQHRSQAFHPDYLVAGRIHAHAPFSFDPDAASAARAAARDRSRPVALAELPPAPPPALADVDLRELIDVVTNPVRGFLRRRLQIDLPREVDQVDDAMPVELDGLASWQVGDRLLHEVLGGRAPAEACQAEWRRGTMPPGRFGWRRTQALAAATAPLVNEFDTATQGIAPHARDLVIDLGGGRRLTGSVTGIHDNRIVRVGYSRLRARQRLEAWISLVALSAAHPGPWVARAIGRGPAEAPARATYSAVEEPMAVIADLVALHDEAMTRVLPLCPDTGRLYAQTRLAEGSSHRPPWMVERDLKDEWRKESAGIEHVTAWGRRPSWEDLIGAPATAGGEHLFGELALRLWQPALAREQE